MEPVVGWVAVAAVAAGLLSAHRQSRARSRVVREAALGCGVIVDEARRFTSFYGGLRGRLGGRAPLGVAIDQERAGLKVVIGGLQVLGDLRLTMEGLGSRIQVLMGNDDVQTGDAEFDRTVRVVGYPPLALAWLDAETRARAMAVFGGRIAVGRGKPVTVRAQLIRGRLETHLVGDTIGVDRLRQALGAIVALASRLHAPRALPPTLAANAGRDPLPGVRLANLRALLREFPDEMVTRDARLRACTDPDEEVALAAALRSKDDGRETLLRLAREAEGDDTAAAAIGALGTSLPADELFQLFKRSRERRRTGRTVACIKTLAVHPQAGTVPELVRLLIDDLASQEDGLPEASARALGHLGSTDVVLPLREAGERTGGTLRGAARQAVAEIQARTQGASPGQVSLASAAAGQVSLAGERSGRVSMVDED